MRIDRGNFSPYYSDVFDFNQLPALGFASTPIPNGHTWSWPSIFYALLIEVEERFGRRNMEFTFLGIEFTSGDVPQTWFPGSSKYVAIQLTDNARLEPGRALFQLAHEVIHLLAPAVGEIAPTLEEGLASVFSHEVSQRHGAGLRSGVPSYERAADLTSQLLAINPMAIRDIRSVEPQFKRITANHILAVAPSLDPKVAHELCLPFVR
jgi:hypothetical protein